MNTIFQVNDYYLTKEVLTSGTGSERPVILYRQKISHSSSAGMRDGSAIFILATLRAGRTCQN
jgi:hypothetical protein